MFNLSLIQTTQIRRAIDCVQIQSLERSMWCGWPLILERCDAIGNPERHVHKASHRSNNRDHARNLSYYCLLALHILWCYSSRTSRSWWITHQLNTTGEVATVATEVYICKQSMISCSATAALVPDLKITPIRGHLWRWPFNEGGHCRKEWVPWQTHNYLAVIPPKSDLRFFTADELNRVC